MIPGLQGFVYLEAFRLLTGVHVQRVIRSKGAEPANEGSRFSLWKDWVFESESAY